MKNTQTLRNKLSALKKISTPLDEKTYWNCIDSVIKHPAKRFDMTNELIKEVEKLSLEEIKGFHLRTQQLVNNIRSSSLHNIAIRLNDGSCSDDGFDYFINWLISQGKEVYYSAKEKPEFLINKYGIGGMYSFEEFSYLADYAFESKTGKDLFSYLD